MTGVPNEARAGERRVALAPDVIQEYLLKTALFQDRAVAFGVAERVEAYEADAGAKIVQAGRQPDWMGLLLKGRASVASVNATTGALSVLEALRPGDHFAETGHLLGGGHTHTVVADETCVYLRVPAEVVKALLAKVPSFPHALARRLAMRVVHLGLTAVRQGSGPSIEAPRLSNVPAPPKAMPAAAAVDGGLRFVEVSEYEPTPNVLSMVPERVILEHRMLPLRLDGNKLTVGMVNPKSEASIEELMRVLQNVALEIVAISQDDFQHSIVRFRMTGGTGAGDAKAGGLRPELLSFDIVDSEREADKAVRVIGDEVVRTVGKILCTAIEREASDIHIEPEASSVRVRFRVHGMLSDWSEFVAPSFAKGIAARLKILAGLDITERRLPQDGRISFMIGKREIDMRLSTLPTSRGEKAVLRIFEAAGMTRPLERSFADKGLLSSIRRTLGRSTGAILVAGGTGSGKSTSLYSMITDLKKSRPHTNVVMVEDPIEYRLQGVTQVQVQHGIGLGFAQVLRATLRQDPDVIVIGETRDPDTARIALEAAMTGHLLMTSLHANDAMSSVQRLETLGCPRELIAQSLCLVLVQRLVRRLCPSCAKTDLPPPVLQESLVTRKLVDKQAQIRVPRAMGCDGCARTGYLGRVAVLEALVVDDDVRNALMAGESLNEIALAAQRSGALKPFHAYASFLMTCNLISAADALMAVAG